MKWIGLGLVAVAGGVAFFALKLGETTEEIRAVNRNLGPAASNVGAITDPLADIFRGIFGDDPDDVAEG